MVKMQSGWSADWVNSELKIKRVVSIVPGPFKVPKLVKITPFIVLTEDELFYENEYHKQNEKKITYQPIYKTGIPDPLLDIITERDFSHSKVIDPLNLNSTSYNSLITNLLWKEYNVSVSQGIPDPWKNWSVLISKGRKHSTKSDLKLFDKKYITVYSVFNKKKYIAKHNF